jgi:predicted site-specific integrase-resolvase
MNTSNITNYKPKDFAELLGVSVKTLQRCDRDGILKANRTPTNRRYYTYEQYLKFKGIAINEDARQIVIYARVSTRNQKNEELSPHAELVQDIISILHVFSCGLYGLRKYKKQIEGDDDIAKELQNRD